MSFVLATARHRDFSQICVKIGGLNIKLWPSSVGFSKDQTKTGIEAQDHIGRSRFGPNPSASLAGLSDLPDHVLRPQTQAFGSRELAHGQMS